MHSLAVGSHPAGRSWFERSAGRQAEHARIDDVFVERMQDRAHFSNRPTAERKLVLQAREGYSLKQVNPWVGSRIHAPW